MYCSPPASLRSSGCTLDCTVLPSCEASIPIPTPSRAIAPAKEAPCRSGPIAVISHRVAASRTSSPALAMVRGEA